MRIVFVNSNSVTHSTITNGFEASDNVANLTTSELASRMIVRRKDTDVESFAFGVSGNEFNFIILRNAAIDNTDISDDTFVFVVVGVKDQGAQRLSWVACWSWDFRNDLG